MISLILCGWTLTKYNQIQTFRAHYFGNQRNEKQERKADMTNIEGRKK